MSYMWLTWQAEDELVSPSSPPPFFHHTTDSQTDPCQGCPPFIRLLTRSSSVKFDHSPKMENV